jgi:hypothetical protein
MFVGAAIGEVLMFGGLTVESWNARRWGRTLPVGMLGWDRFVSRINRPRPILQSLPARRSPPARCLVFLPVLDADATDLFRRYRGHHHRVGPVLRP